MDKIEFINKETNTNITLVLDKNFIIIYGKNGSGKTTLSRNAPNKDCVFNTDFIHRNVYVETPNGASDDKQTKIGFSSLWIGEKLVQLRKELTDIRQNKTKVEEKQKELLLEYQKTFATAKVDLLDFKSINTIIDAINYSKPSDKKDDEIIADYKATVKLPTTYSNDDEVNKAVIQLQENTAVKMLLGKIKENKFLEEVLLSDNKEQQDFLNEYLTDYNKFNSVYKDLSKDLKKDKPDEEKWLQMALDLHKDIDECLFCGNTNIEKAKEKWRSLLNSKAQTIKNNLLTFIKKCDEVIVELLKSESNYSKIAGKTIKNVHIIQDYFVNIKKAINDNEAIKEDLKLPIIEKEKIVVEKNDLLINIQNYMFGKYISRYEIIRLLCKDYSEKEAKKDQEIVQELDKNADEIKDSINNYLIKLGLEKELKIKIDGRGNDKKYAFGFVNSSVGLETLSEGQKHKLALAIFFAKIQRMDLTDKVVVLDDPVITLDNKTYHSVKEQILELRKSDTNMPKHLIVLTHNVSYLYLQLSNIFNHPERAVSMKLMHLHPNRIEEMDLDILNFDDLTLYKKAIEKMSNLEEFNLVAFLNLRIVRYFLDMKCRMIGYPSAENPSPSIGALVDLEESNRDRLKEISNQLSEQCRDTNSTNQVLQNSFVLCNEFVKLLGFPSLLSQKDFDKVLQFANKEKRSVSYSGDDLMFGILHRAFLIMTSNKPNLKPLKDYLDHPRIQLTSTIVGFDLTDADLL